MPVTVPDSLDTALAALAADPDATVLAGGTDLMVEVNDGRRPLDARRGDRAGPRAPRGARRGRRTLVIGAATTYTDCSSGSRSPSSPRRWRTRRGRVGSPQIRNAGTIGGNLATASPAGDTLPVLVALGATIEVAGAGTGRRMCRSTSSSPARSARCSRPGELVVAVRVPVRRGPQDYLKVGVRNAMVIAVASLAIVVDLDARTDRHRARIGRADAAWRARTHARGSRRARRGATTGLGVSEADTDEFAARVESAALADRRPPRAPREYRRHAVGVLARRALRRCVS